MSLPATGQAASITEAEQIMALSDRVAALRSRRDLLIESKNESLAKVDGAERYIEYAPEVYALLEKAQLATQSKERELFEGLLTTLLQETIGGNSDEVKIRSRIARNQTELDINIISDGVEEDVFKDKGGSIKNIISMGLRFIVLSRSSNRRFLIFDEADCWLKSDYIPAFARMMGQLSVKTGVQVVYISHHNPELFEGHARILELSKNDKGIICSNCVSDAAINGAPDSEVGGVAATLAKRSIDYLRLVNFRQHSNTILDLSPHVTVITGDNDLGKSATLEAFESISSGKIRPSQVNHGQTEAYIEIGVEQDKAVSLRYKTKGAKKSHLRVTNSDGKTVHETRDLKALPKWMVDLLAMHPVEGVNLHIHDQDHTCFMMGPAYPPSMRAKLLSLGRGGDQARKMILLHSERLTESKRTARDETKKIAEVNGQLNALNVIDFLHDSLAEAVEADKIVTGELSAVKKLNESIVLLERSRGEVLVLSGVACLETERQEGLDVVAAFSSISQMPLMVRDFNRANSEKMLCEGALNQLEPLKMQASGELNITQIRSLFDKSEAVCQMAKKLSESHQEVAALAPVAKLRILAPTINAEIAQVPGQLVEMTKKVIAYEKEQAEITKEGLQAKKTLTLVQDEKVLLIERDGACPLCGQATKHNHRMAS